MRPSSTAATVGVGILLLAWLASALNEPRTPRPDERPAPAAESAQLQELRADVQAQAERLRTRMASAPAPQAPNRNPFAFARREAPSVKASAPPAVEAAVPEPLPPQEITLSLIGIAERKAGEAIVRTAILAGASDDVHLVTEGEDVLGQYRVRAVTPELVELEHLVTGAVRRLRLQ